MGRGTQGRVTLPPTQGRPQGGLGSAGEWRWQGWFRKATDSRKGILQNSGRAQVDSTQERACRLGGGEGADSTARRAAPDQAGQRGC